MKVKCYGLGKKFYDRCNAAELLAELGIVPEKIAEDAAFLSTEHKKM